MGILSIFISITNWFLTLIKLNLNLSSLFLGYYNKIFKIGEEIILWGENLREKIKSWIDRITGKVVVKVPVEKGKEEYIELSPEQVSGRVAKIYVKKFVLTDFADIKPILDSLREGYTIAFIKVKPLRDKDIKELRRATDKVKKTIEAIEGEIVGIDEDWIVAVPSFVEVHPGEKAPEFETPE